MFKYLSKLGVIFQFLLCDDHFLFQDFVNEARHLPLLVLSENEVALLVTLELATEVENIETTSIEIEETRKVLVGGQLFFIKFFSAVLVTNVTFTVN